MTMPAKEAAKVLSVFNAWRCDEHVEIEPPSPRQVTAALGVAVAALEAVDCDTPPPADEIPTIEQMREILNGHPRERALSEDAARGNFRAPK